MLESCLSVKEKSKSNDARNTGWIKLSLHSGTILDVGFKGCKRLYLGHESNLLDNKVVNTTADVDANRSVNIMRSPISSIVVAYKDIKTGPDVGDQLFLSNLETILAAKSDIGNAKIAGVTGSGKIGAKLGTRHIDLGCNIIVETVHNTTATDKTDIGFDRSVTKLTVAGDQQTNFAGYTDSSFYAIGYCSTT